MRDLPGQEEARGERSDGHRLLIVAAMTSQILFQLVFPKSTLLGIESVAMYSMVPS